MFKFSQQTALHMPSPCPWHKWPRDWEVDYLLASQEDTLRRAKVFYEHNKGVPALYQAPKSPIVLPHNIYQRHFHLMILPINQSMIILAFSTIRMFILLAKQQPFYFSDIKSTLALLFIAGKSARWHTP